MRVFTDRNRHNPSYWSIITLSNVATTAHCPPFEGVVASIRLQRRLNRAPLGGAVGLPGTGNTCVWPIAENTKLLPLFMTCRRYSCPMVAAPKEPVTSDVAASHGPMQRNTSQVISAWFVVLHPTRNRAKMSPIELGGPGEGGPSLNARKSTATWTKPAAPRK